MKDMIKRQAAQDSMSKKMALCLSQMHLEAACHYERKAYLLANYVLLMVADDSMVMALAYEEYANELSG